MRIEVLVIADDLTGAADTAVEFRGLGAAQVMIEPFPRCGLPEEGEFGALAVHTGSRDTPEELVPIPLVSAHRLLARVPRALTYRKVDSNLRGNIGLDLEAALSVGLGSFALLCPAFPARGRTVVDGICRVDGVPVADTEMGRDPGSAVRESRVAKVVEAQTEAAVAHVGLEQVRADPRTLRALLRRTALTGARIIIADAETEDDLRRLALAALRIQDEEAPTWTPPERLEIPPGLDAEEAVDHVERAIVGHLLGIERVAARILSRGRPLLAGSAGLAREVAALIGPRPRYHSGPGPSGVRARPVLVIEGSVSQAWKSVV